MKAAEEFDVVIVYEGNIAKAASDTGYRGRSPFSKKGEQYSYNESYEYFLEGCKQKGLRAAFATTHDITDAGLFSAVWVFNKKWTRLRKEVRAKMIYDKFSNQETYNAKFSAMLKSSKSSPVFFHNQKIRELFDNKLKTFAAFPEFAIPTVKIKLGSNAAISAAKKKLRKQMKAHKQAGNFSEQLVLKDQYGAGGQNVFKVSDETNLKRIGKRDTSIAYLLQPLVIASGFIFSKHRGNIDLRVIVCGGEITQCYIRVPQPGVFKANASNGGTVIYIPVGKIPKEVILMAKRINEKLPVKDGFYALDFIKSNGANLYFIEGNITPGLIWFNQKDEVQVKKMMRTIIDNITLRLSQA